MHHRTTKDVQSGIEEHEEFARHRAHKLHKELFETKGHHKDVHNTNFFRSCVLTTAKFTATDLSIHSIERMYIVDSGASLHNDGIIVQKIRLFDSRATFWKFRPPVALWSQTHELNIKELGACLWIHLVKDSPPVRSLGRLCNELGCSQFVADSTNSPIIIR